MRDLDEYCHLKLQNVQLGYNIYVSEIDYQLSYLNCHWLILEDFFKLIFKNLEQKKYFLGL